MGKIIQGVPVSAMAARRSVPANVDAAIRKALEKLPADRFTSALDFAEALADAGFRHGTPGFEAQRGSRALGWAGWLTSAALLTWIAFGPESSTEPAPPRVSFAIDAEDGAPIRSFDPPQISQDGTTLACVALDGGQPKLQVRKLDEPSARWIAGTEGVRDAFFSADGGRIAFFSEAGLKSVNLESGQVELLAKGDNLGTFQQSGVWLADGWILFSHEDTPDLWGLPPGDDEAVLLFDHTEVEGASRLRLPAPIPLTGTRAVIAIIGVDERTRPAIVDAEARLLLPIEAEAEGVPLAFWDGTLALVNRDLILVDLDPMSGGLGNRTVLDAQALQQPGVDASALS